MATEPEIALAISGQIRKLKDDGTIPYFAQHTGVTTVETLLGFTIAALIGEAVAIAMVYSRPLERTLYPIVLFAQVIPKRLSRPVFCCGCSRR